MYVCIPTFIKLKPSVADYFFSYKIGYAFNKESLCTDLSVQSFNSDTYIHSCIINIHFPIEWHSAGLLMPFLIEP